MNLNFKNMENNFCENCGDSISGTIHRVRDDNYVAIVCETCAEELGDEILEDSTTLEEKLAVLGSIE